VLLRVAGGELLLAGDAVYSKRSLDERLLPLFTWRDHVYRETLERLRGWRDAHPEATMIFGHDAEEWPKLAEVY
jgi:glyoxylase-like metal-dependent hydrolase (beta-lactamase superfamily II)